MMLLLQSLQEKGDAVPALRGSGSEEEVGGGWKDGNQTQTLP